MEPRSLVILTTPHRLFGTARSFFLISLIVLVSASSLWFITPQTGYAAGQTHLAYVRVNQVGYLTGETKQAILLASGPEKGATFRVLDASSGRMLFHAAIGASRGKWSS